MHDLISPFSRFDKELKQKIVNEYQQMAVEPITARVLSKESLIHFSIIAFSVYSAYVGWGASKAYVNSPNSLMSNIHNGAVADEFGNFVGFCNVLVNTMQAADILWAEVEKIRRSVSEEERALLGEHTLLQRIKNNPGVIVYLIFAAAAAIPLGFIMYNDSGSELQAVLTFLTNIPVNYRGVSNLGAYFPVRPCMRLKPWLLKTSKDLLVQHLSQSYENLLQKPKYQIQNKLDRLDEIRVDGGHDVVLELLNLDRDHLAAESLLRSTCRTIFMAIITMLVVNPQFGYILDSWDVGADLNESNHALSIVLLLLSAIVDIGLSLDAALDISGALFSGRATLYEHLNKPLVLASSLFLVITSIFSGAMLADTNLDNMMDGYRDNSTAVVHFPLPVTYGFEVCSFPSEGLTNYYYALHYVCMFMHLYYKTRSRDEYKRKLVKLNDVVTHMVSLIMNMSCSQYKRLITDPAFPQQRLSGIFKSVFSDKELDYMLDVEGDKELLVFSVT